MLEVTKNIQLNLIVTNTGQIEGLPKNPRLIKNERYDKLKQSISEDPEMLELRELIVYPVNGKFVTIAGNMRLKVMQELKFKEAPCKVLAAETPIEKIRAYAVKDNVPFGEWDWDTLANEWDQEELAEWGVEIPEMKTTDEAEEDDFEIPEEVKTDIMLGDIIEIGRHRLVCGDSTDNDILNKLMDGKKADMVFTDPPYNVNYGSVLGHPYWKRTRDKDNKLSTRRAGNDRIKNDNLSEDDWGKFVDGYMKNILAHNNGAVYICMSNKEMYSNQKRFIELGGNWSSFIIWKKDSFVLGMSDYQRQYEPIFYGWKKGSKKFWCGDRNQSDVWEVKRPKSSPEHPTMKPIELCGRAITNSSGNNNIVLDLFAGSGSTMVAAHQINRLCYAIELDPKYCQVIVDRMKKLDQAIEIKKNGVLI